MLFDLVTAVLLGLVVAGFVALRQTAKTARLDEVPLDEGDHTDEEQSLLDEHIVAYRIDGPLFFAAAHDFLLELSDVSNVRVVILRMSRVTTIDATGAHVLADTITRLEGRGITVLLSGSGPAMNGSCASSASTADSPTSVTSSTPHRKPSPTPGCTPPASPTPPPTPPADEGDAMTEPKTGPPQAPDGSRTTALRAPTEHQRHHRPTMGLTWLAFITVGARTERNRTTRPQIDEPSTGWWGVASRGLRLTWIRPSTCRNNL